MKKTVLMGLFLCVTFAYAGNPAVTLTGDDAQTLYDALQVEEVEFSNAGRHSFSKTVSTSLEATNPALECTKSSAVVRVPKDSYLCQLTENLSQRDLRAVYSALDPRLEESVVAPTSAWKKQVANLDFRKIRTNKGGHVFSVGVSAPDPGTPPDDEPEVESLTVDGDGARDIYEALDVEPRVTRNLGPVVATKGAGSLTCRKTTVFRYTTDGRGRQKTSYSCTLRSE